MTPPTRAQQLALWIPATILGLTLASLLHADALAAIGLVAMSGTIVGLGWAIRNAHLRD